jgi:hypothetical protein
MMMDPLNTKTENDLRALRDVELDAVTGGAEVLGTLNSAVSQTIKSIGDTLTTVTRAG